MQAVEFPVVAPQAVGKRHSYAYCVGDIVRDKVFWGPLQVRNGEGGRGKQATRLLITLLRFVSAPAIPPDPRSLPLRAVVKVTLPKRAAVGASLRSETWEPGPRSFCGEPMFVPR